MKIPTNLAVCTAMPPMTQGRERVFSVRWVEITSSGYGIFSTVWWCAIFTSRQRIVLKIIVSVKYYFQ